MSKPPKQCIFCERGRLSREHFWSEWMHPYLNSTATSRVLFSETFTRRTVSLGRRVREMLGPVIKTKLRVVCRPCNNTWMSQLENEVKPTLLPLMLGEPGTLNSQRQEAAGAMDLFEGDGRGALGARNCCDDAER